MILSPLLAPILIPEGSPDNRFKLSSVLKKKSFRELAPIQSVHRSFSIENESKEGESVGELKGAVRAMEMLRVKAVVKEQSTKKEYCKTKLFAIQNCQLRWP